jgi:Cu/Ag efflux protein CusF
VIYGKPGRYVLSYLGGRTGEVDEKVSLRGGDRKNCGGEVMMKRIASTVLVMAGLSLMCAGPVAAKMETATGKVTAIDAEGKAIVIVQGKGYSARTVGPIVSPDTVIKVKGKKADLKSIKVGDKVTVKLERSDNQYAKQIIKK